MYFAAIPLKNKKPSHIMWNNRHVALLNPKTRDFHTIKVGVSIEWEYFIARGFTHWIQPIDRKKLKILLDDEKSKAY